MEKKNYKQRAIKLCISVVAVTALLILLLVLKNNTAVSEFFATHFARWWITVAGFLFGWLPFSVYELLVAICVVYAICAIAVIITRLVKRRLVAGLCALLTLLLVCVSFGTIYTATASMSYNRASLPIERYSYSDAEEPLTREQAIDFANLYISNLNTIYNACEHDKDGFVTSPYTLSELNEKLWHEYDRVSLEYAGYFSPYNAKAKTPLSSWLFSQLGISGLFFAPFGEVNINGYENTFYLPVTLAHELAHSKGVMRENDANTVARYVCLTSDDRYILYSAYLGCLSQVLTLVSLYPDTEAVVENMLDSVEDKAIEQLNATVEYWEQFDLLSGVGTFFNNIYLKLSGQGGTVSYNPPYQADDTGEVDSEGNPILEIKNFSDAGNLLVAMYLDGKLDLQIA